MVLGCRETATCLLQSRVIHSIFLSIQQRSRAGASGRIYCCATYTRRDSMKWPRKYALTFPFAKKLSVIRHQNRPFLPLKTPKKVTPNS